MRNSNLSYSAWGDAESSWATDGGRLDVLRSMGSMTVPMLRSIALPATRILDTLPMARGGRGDDDASIAMHREFLAVLPEAAREAAKALATTLQLRFGHNVLKPDARKTAA